MQLVKTYWLPLVASFLVFIPLMFVLWLFDFNGNFVATTVAFFTLFLWFRRKSLSAKQRQTNTVLVLMPMVVWTVFYSWYGVHSLNTMPNNVIAPLLGIGFGAAFQAFGSAWMKAAVVCAGLLLNGWVWRDGYRWWMNYRIYGTYDGQLAAKTSPDFSFQDAATGQAVTPVKLRGKVVVLDFWNTSCAVCFHKFPVVQERKERWSKHAGVAFYTVNVRLDRDTTGQAVAALQKHNVQVPALLGPGLEEAKNRLAVSAYPAVWILNQQGQLVYHGSIEDIDPVLAKLTDKP
ncbi:MAG: TlpA family protein disulfide reductase [Cytophagales bacterium]|nr:TlpA family protein disulfide reductase [Cytophagales bacterium]